MNPLLSNENCLTTCQLSGKECQTNTYLYVHTYYISVTLKSLIEEQTGINEQGWEKIPPCLLFLLSKLINERVEFFVY